MTEVDDERQALRRDITSTGSAGMNFGAFVLTLVAPGPLMAKAAVVGTLALVLVVRTAWCLGHAAGRRAERAREPGGRRRAPRV